jgi:hypothetical protein
MSYCADASPLGDPVHDPLTDDAWVSVHNWNAVLEKNRYHRPVVAAQATGSRIPSLHVNGFVLADGTGASIASVTPLDAQAQPASGSAYHLVGSDAAGKPVADVALLESLVHGDGHPPELDLNGVIPAAGVVSVAIVKDGTTLATRARSAHAPAVSLSGLPAVRHGSATIRWHGSDADGDPLETAIDYSPDGGASFHRIWVGGNPGRAQFPARYLSRSSRARVRVTVNDGFQTASATSKSFRAPGAAPVVTITSPAQGLRQPNDAPLVLSGQAFDDTGAALTGGRLRWRLGRRVLGTGSDIARAGLPAGRHRIDLLARDGAGRTGRASVVVVLKAAQPLFLSLSAPRGVTRAARSLRLRVSSSLATGLLVRVAGVSAQRFAVSRRERTIRVRIPGGRKAVALRLSLGAGGLTRMATLSVPRR